MCAALVALLPGMALASPMAAFDPALGTLPGFTTFQNALFSTPSGEAAAPALTAQIVLFQSGLVFDRALVGPWPADPPLSPAAVGVAMAGFIGNLQAFTPLDTLRVVFNFDLPIPVIATPAFAVTGPFLAAPGAAPITSAPDPAATSQGHTADGPAAVLTPAVRAFAASTASPAPSPLQPSVPISVIVTNLMRAGPSDTPGLMGVFAEGSVAGSTAPRPGPAPVLLPAAIWSLLLGLAALTRLRCS